MYSAVETLVVASFFGCWLGLTVLYARPRGPRELGRFGPLGLLVPSWNFFAPKPGVHDYYLIVREVAPAGPGPWRQITELDPTRSWSSAVWNPGKLQKKAVFDLSMTLVQDLPSDLAEWDLETSQDRLQTLKLSLPYLALANYVESLEVEPLSVGRQFAIVRELSADGSLELLVTSGVHPCVVRKREAA